MYNSDYITFITTWGIAKYNNLLKDSDWILLVHDWIWGNSSRMNKYLITIDNNFKDNEKILNHVINRNPIDDICDEMIITIKSEPKIITLMIKALNYYKD